MPADALTMLLSRLSWPSLVARERAATEIAKLLAHPECASEVRQRLLAWMQRQQLETLCAVGLLVFLRAAALCPAFVPPSATELDQVMGRPSLLSWLLRGELLGQSEADLEGMAAPHSGQAPPDFEPPATFHSQLKRYLPWMYAGRAERMEENTSLPITAHWAWEWERVLANLGAEPPPRTIDFWIGRGDRFASSDTLRSEAYRSAYLRTLAWALSTTRLPPPAAAYLAAETCPVDLGLWNVESQPRPSWWPTVEDDGSGIDTIAARLWQQCAALWERERTEFGDDVLAYAKGVAYDGAVTYEIEIGGLLQHSAGPEVPDVDAVADWIFGENRVRMEGTSLLRLSGTIRPRRPSECSRSFGDWTFMPLGGGARLITVPRWQPWRLRDDAVWLPAGLLTQSPLELLCTPKGVETLEGAELVGSWQDWLWGMRERRHPLHPEYGGQQLRVRRARVEALASATKSRYCWICRITTHHRPDRYRHDYERIATSRFFGTSGIVLP